MNWRVRWDDIIFGGPTRSGAASDKKSEKQNSHVSKDYKLQKLTVFEEHRARNVSEKTEQSHEQRL